MKFVYVLPIVVIIVFCIEQIYGQANETCIRPDHIIPLQNFTAEKFLGTWYGIKTYSALSENVVPLPYRCLKVTFTQTNSVILPVAAVESYVNVTDSTSTPILTPYYMSFTEKEPASWTLVNVENEEILESNLVFVQTDYENWALQYGCNVRDHYRWENMFILLRSPTPDPELMKTLDVIVQSYRFRAENAREVDQTC